MISVVTPWRTLLSALGLIGKVKSECVLMSMKPGVTARPSASITLVAPCGTERPSAAIRPSRTATSPTSPGRPLPSIKVPPRIRMSQVMAGRAALSAATETLCDHVSLHRLRAARRRLRVAQFGEGPLQHREQRSLGAALEHLGDKGAAGLQDLL